MTTKQQKAIDVDTLAQFIRKIDGNNSMGAGDLAEKIIESGHLSIPPPGYVLVPEEVLKKINSVMEISAGYMAWAAQGEKYPVLKERAQSDCNLLSEAIMLIDPMLSVRPGGNNDE